MNDVTVLGGGDQGYCDDRIRALLTMGKELKKIKAHQFKQNIKINC